MNEYHERFKPDLDSSSKAAWWKLLNEKVTKNKLVIEVT